MLPGTRFDLEGKPTQPDYPVPRDIRYSAGADPQMDFAKKLLTEAHVAVAPGVGFGEEGEGFVRIALVENEQRLRQAARGIKKMLADA